MKTKSTFIIHLGGLKNIRPSIFDAIHVVEGRTSWAIDLPQILSCLMETDRILQAFEAASDLGHCRILQGKSVFRRTQSEVLEQGTQQVRLSPVGVQGMHQEHKRCRFCLNAFYVHQGPGTIIPCKRGNRIQRIGQQKLFARDVKRERGE